MHASRPKARTASLAKAHGQRFHSTKLLLACDVPRKRSEFGEAMLQDKLTI